MSNVKRPPTSNAIPNANPLLNASPTDSPSNLSSALSVGNVATAVDPYLPPGFKPAVVATTSGRAMTANEHAILTYCEQFYTTNSRLPNTGDIVSVGFTKELFHTCLKLPAFNKGLEARGIIPYTLLDSNGKPPANLSPTQLVAINTMMDIYDTRSKNKRLKDLEISTQTWNTWLRNPTFRAYLQRRGKLLLGDAEPEVNYALVDRARSGDMKAIEYFNEINGIYSRQATKGVDIHGILYQVLEIVQKRITDQNIQQLIAMDLLAIIEPVAPQLNGVPLIAKEFKEIAGVEPDGIKPEYLEEVVDTDSNYTGAVIEVIPEKATSPYDESVSW